MKTNLVLLFCLLFGYAAHAQQYMTREGYVRFYSSTPIEDIEAINNQTTALLKSTGEFAFRVPILGFRFEKALMEEHFNENYMESTTFPNGSFEGRITDWNEGLKDGSWHNVNASGSFTIHGKAQQRDIPAKVRWDGEKWTIESNFLVKPADHDIEIPSMVSKKIAESIEVTVEATLNPR